VSKPLSTASLIINNKNGLVLTLSRFICQSLL
jgi:hypothetical protein